MTIIIIIEIQKYDEFYYLQSINYWSESWRPRTWEKEER